MARQLPIVLIEGQKYFLEERLKEFRHVENPFSRIPFNQMGDRKATEYNEEAQDLKKEKRQKLKRGNGL